MDERYIRELKQINAPLKAALFKVARYHECYPYDGSPYIDDLRIIQAAIVEFVLNYIIAAKSLKIQNTPSVADWFKFVFRRGVSYTYQWYHTKGRWRPEILNVGNPLNDENFLQLPEEKKHQIMNSEIPQLLFEAMSDWCKDNHINSNGKSQDMLCILNVALFATFEVGEYYITKAEQRCGPIA